MADNLMRIRGKLKAQWVAANKKVLDLRRMVTDAEQKAASLQRVLAAVEKAAPESVKGGEAVPVRHSTRNSLPRIIEVLKEKGALSTQQIAAEVGASYWTVLSHLKSGPFRQGPRAVGKGKSRPWSLVQGESGFAGEKTK